MPSSKPTEASSTRQDRRALFDVDPEIDEFSALALGVLGAGELLLIALKTEPAMDALAQDAAEARPAIDHQHANAAPSSRLSRRHAGSPRAYDRDVISRLRRS